MSLQQEIEISQFIVVPMFGRNYMYMPDCYHAYKLVLVCHGLP